jgi:hypothetical protein
MERNIKGTEESFNLMTKEMFVEKNNSENGNLCKRKGGFFK